MRRFLATLPLLLFFVPSLASADARRVIVSEIAWAGSSASTADEWLELHNPAAEAADVSGWFLEGAASGGAVLEFPPGSVIPPGGVFLVSNYGADDPKSTLDARPDWVTTAVALSNSGLHLVLRDAEGRLVDEAGAPGKAPFAGQSGTVKASMERVSAVLPGTAPEAWKTAAASLGFDPGATELGTPGFHEEAPSEPATGEPAAPEPEEGSEPRGDEPAATEPGPEPEAPAASPTPEPPMSAVRLSEIYPFPFVGELEWVELVNLSSVGEFLDGLFLEEGSGKRTPLAGILQPWGRLVIESPKGSLNNDGDLVRLVDAHGRTLDGLTYGIWRDGRFQSHPAPKRGQSLMRVGFGGGFAVTATPTPGEENFFTDPAPPAPEPPSSPVVKPPLTEPPAAPTSPTPPAAPPSAPSTTPPIAAPPASPAKPASVPASAAQAASAAPAVVPPSTLKAAAVPAAKTAAKPAAASRYKGEPYAAVIAIPPGVYSKARMRVLAAGAVWELRLSASTKEAFRAGEEVRFVAQIKEEAGRPHLAANVNSLERTGRVVALDFAPAEAWPDRAGAYELVGSVEEISGKTAVLEAGGRRGLVESPISLAGKGLEPGDRVAVKGFVETGELPRLVLAAADAMRLLEPMAPSRLAAPEPARLPAFAAAGLIAAAAISGIAFHLRQERLKRAALLAPLVEAE